MTMSEVHYLQPAVLSGRAGCNGSGNAENVVEGHQGLQRAPIADAEFWSVCCSWSYTGAGPSVLAGSGEQ